MAGRVYIHLGPPKTATTSLQLALRQAAGDWFEYGGAAQPQRDTGDMASRLHSLCLMGWAESDAALSAWRSDAAAITAGGKDLIISEELLLVDGARADMQQKVARLADILRGFETVGLFCIREPLEGLRSLYQELYGGLRLGEKVRFDTFLASSQARVFDYAALPAILQAAGFGELRAFAFEDLVAGKLTFRDLLGPEAPDGPPFEIPRVNVGKVGRNARVRRLGAIRMRDVAPLKLLRRTAALDKLRASRSIQYIRSVSSLTLRGEVDAELPIPPEKGEPLSEGYRALLSHVRQTGGRL